MYVPLELPLTFRTEIGKTPINIISRYILMRFQLTIMTLLFSVTDI